MTRHALPVAVLGLALGPLAPAQSLDSRLGYMFPAGGRAGSSIEVIAGGQNLRGAKSAHVVHPGVTVTVRDHYRAVRNINGEERRELLWRIQSRCAVLRGRDPLPVPRGLLEARRQANPNPDKEPPPIRLPDHPLVAALDHANLRELGHLLISWLPDNRAQQNQQLADLVSLHIAIAPEAPPGRCEIRLHGPAGLTNPLVFHIGALPEVHEFEPNDPCTKVPMQIEGFGDQPALPPVAVPFTANGQVLPGDVDHFRFTARRGQSLVIRTHARDLIPYLADAVPGWFQMIVAVRDPDGKEVAWADDFRFSPDPVLRFVAQRDGVYDLEVRDSIYRGREDFVYRIEVGELPFITEVFPLGATRGTATVAAINGWNLPAKSLPLATTPDGLPVRFASLPPTPFPCNPVPFIVDDLPSLAEREPNNAPPAAQSLELPRIIDGRLDQPGDVDTFRIEGRAGQQIVAEVFARRLNSPLDSLVRITDVTGEVLAWNDDRMDKEGHLHLGAGLLTHHADSYLHATLPSAGPWFITIIDSQNQGGSSFAYRLRISEPRPDFELRVTPSAVNVVPGAHAPVEVFALRNDGFEGAIDLALCNAPSGFTLSGGRIPPGRDRIRCTLAAPSNSPKGPLTLALEGRGESGGRVLIHPAQPADDTMQAFLWRHLLPADEWLVSSSASKTRRPPITIATELPVRIPVGGRARVTVTTQSWLIDRGIQFEPSQPPAGLTVSPARKVAEGLAFDLTVDPAKLPPGSADNLLVEGFAPVGDQAKKSKKTKASRWSAGFLPAIPFVVTNQ
jgi:hypothetical protein